MTHDARIQKYKSADELKAEELYRQYCLLMESHIGKDETDTDQLNRMGFTYIPNFLGTYARDQIPKNIKPDQSIVLNEGKMSTGGWHWMAIYCMPNGQYLFYDSFGRGHKTVLRVNTLNGKKMIDADMKDREQIVSENNCGCRALAFLLVASRHGHHLASLI